VTEIRDKNGKLCHLIHRFEDFQPGRKDLIDSGEFLQCASLQMEEGKTFKPHQHKWNHWEGQKIAQESWVVLNGRVQVSFFDEGGEFIKSDILDNGDASFTLYGGHNYEALETETKVLEFKTGPYFGQEHDKTFI